MSSSPARGTTLKPMPGTYTAVEVSAPRELRVVERRVAEPGPGQVRIRVEACGVCHSDSATVEGLFPIDWPRVPGHDALGPGVQGWAVGQRLRRAVRSQQRE
jgi:alcohol dehydrogenase, propanol-preferring